MTAPARRGGLQRKFFFTLLLVGILPGIAALVATYLYSTHSLKHSIGSGFQEIARSAALRLASTVDAEIDRAERLALVPVHIRRNVEAANRRYEGKSRDEIRSLLDRMPPTEDRRRDNGSSGSHQETVDYLQQWVAKTRYYIDVTVTDREGVTVASSDPDAPLFNRDQLWWQEVMGGGGAAYVSSLKWDGAFQDYVFDVAAPILSRDGSGPIGVVHSLIRRGALMHTVLTIHVGETGHGMLVDTDGTPLICPVLPPTSHLIHQALLNQFTSDQPTWFVAEDDAHGGHQTLVGSAPVRIAHPLTPKSLGGTRWFAFVRQQPEETYAPIYNLLITVGLIGFGLVVALASSGFFVGRRIVAPISSLRQEAEELRQRFAGQPGAGGRAEARPATQGAAASLDEIEDLARSFHTMRTALEESLSTVREQQEQLIRRERLASVGQLLAALAHDLRNPLGVIRSSAQIMLDRNRPEPVKEEVARYVIDEVDRLTHRINDFLRYARQKPPEPELVSADALLREALHQWNAQGGQERIRVDLRLAPDLPLILVDPHQVKEALVNLFMNASEAMPDGGTLTVGTKRAASGSVELTVADTGLGISEANLRRIFEPFFTTKEFGTGLGLTNVKRLVEDNGGTLHVTSKEGAGTEFVLYFPAHCDLPTAARNSSRSG
ncbi:Histidine kinase [Nitrospira tepida]|uniref:histidine kinase n=1 Tax=Nitrospira tepida TaxID=2973512 RepID=A0AA86MXP0_9BACT|nr:ATP-binding protein [Nitrospira tepida]CAI4030960.1 Histidine kinase [Nitrospira tepida]